MSSEFWSEFPPRRNRAHEACGPGALFFALSFAAQVSGPVLWVSEGWRADRINPVGLSDFLAPGRLLTAEARDHLELLAVGEEALRSGSVALVVMELNKPIGLTEGRRLQLAAETGKTRALSIISADAGSNAAETRWQCTPVFDPVDSTLQRWELIKNKSGTLGVWDISWDAKARRVHVVSKTGERPGSESRAG